MISKFLYFIYRISPSSTFKYFEIRGKRHSKSKQKEIESIESGIEPFDSDKTLGIVKEPWGMHVMYVKACIELNIEYYLLDIFESNWLKSFTNAQVDLWIFRPSVQYRPWKQMFDNRIKLIEESCNIVVFPRSRDLWLWESKLRTSEWLQINNIPHPVTKIYYREEEVKNNLTHMSFPIVAKSDFGSGSSGVSIIRSKRSLKKYTKRVFHEGLRSYRNHVLDREHGFLILQEYLEEVKEWRIIRIGRYYFGYEKVKVGEFHSGSKNFKYGMPPNSVLTFVRDLTDSHNIKYSDIDVFITNRGEILVNEIQPYFGQKDDRELLRVNGQSGRLFYDYKHSKWIFESGEYCRNNLANLRIKEILSN